MLSQKLRFCQNLVKSSTSIVTEMAFVVAAANSASNLTQYCQYILSQGNMSPPENESTVYRGNFVSGQLRKSSLEKTHKGQQRSKSPKEINFSAWKTSKRGRLQYFPQRFPTIVDPEQVSPSVPRALDEWEHYLGINGEWSTMIPTNAFNGEIPSKYKCSQWRRHEGRDARAICPSLILACFQFIPEISSVSNGKYNVFPKYVFFYVMQIFIFFVKVSFHVFIPFLPPLTSGFDLCPT